MNEDRERGLRKHRIFNPMKRTLIAFTNRSGLLLIISVHRPGIMNECSRSVSRSDIPKAL